jgi:hypothetical protein
MLTGPRSTVTNEIKRYSSRKARLLAAAAAAILALSLVMTVNAASTTLTAPTSATLGSSITVSGSGFAAAQTGNLTYNGGVVATFTASSAGAVNVPMTIPSWAVIGAGRISAKTSAGTVLATTTVNIVGAASIQGPPVAGAWVSVPAQAAPGTTIAATGGGFAAGQAGDLTINGCKEATFTASAAGAFTAAFPIPSATTLGTGRISAKSTAGTLLATTTLTIGVGGPGAIPTPPPTATATGASPSTSPTAAPSGNLPNFSHVYVIIFENKEYSSVIGSSSAPFINSLAAKYGSSTSFYAERHPSEPNYIALTSGGTQGVSDDGVYNLGVNNLFDQVQASGRTWKAVMQGKPAGCFTGSSSSAVVDGVGKSGAYVRKHDPAISYTSISGNAAKCANITNLASFDPAGANYQFITPNMINDMHDGTVADGDNFLKAFLPKITTSPAFANSVVFVTFDEGTTNVNGGGHIATIAITPNMTAGYKAAASYTHYSMLRTIEQAWGLPFLGSAASATSMAFPY